MKVVNLTQGTPEWHTWRSTGIGGSDAPAVMGISPYKTPLELWKEKSGLEVKSEEGKAYLFERGHSTEEKIRQDFLQHTGLPLEPLCVEHSDITFLKASLDGFSEVAGILEAKLVGAEVLKAAMKGEIPPHHFTQMQHQFLASGIPEGFYYCHNGKNSGVLIEIEEDKEYQKRLLDQEYKFWDLVRSNIAPELSEKDYLEVDPKDPNAPLFQDLLYAKALLEEQQKKIDKLKKQITETYIHPKISCGRVTLIKVKREGSINWKSVPEVKDLESDYLNQFKGKPSESWTLRVLGEKA